MHSKSVEKGGAMAEELNQRFAMFGYVVSVGPYIKTDQVISGLV